MKFKTFLSIKEEISAFSQKELLLPEDENYDYTDFFEAYDAEDNIDEVSSLNEAESLRTSNNPLAKMFRLYNTMSAKRVINTIYKKHLASR